MDERVKKAENYRICAGGAASCTPAHEATSPTHGTTFLSISCAHAH